jgi:molybdopterin biosynthesis enzyme
MTSTWMPSLEPWGLPYHLFEGLSGVHNDMGPVAIGRVFGTEVMAVADALNRVAATAVKAQRPFPHRLLAAVSGVAIRSQDTQAASQTQPLKLDSSIRMSHCLGNAETEQNIAVSHMQAVESFAFLLPGGDAVLKPTSSYYKGTTMLEKTGKKIIQPVPEGTDVVVAGAGLEEGEQLLHEGRRLSAGDIAALCMAGIEEIEVFSRPQVAVCVINRYFKESESLSNTTAMPDGITPMVLALLGQWGVKVESINHFDFTNRKFNAAASREINSVAEHHDLTIVLGFLGDSSEMSSFEGTQKIPPIAEPVFNLQGPDISYSLRRGIHRPADIARLMTGGEVWNENRRKDRCKLLVAMQGLPLSVLTSMYMVVKPALDALSGVGAFPVPIWSDHPFASTPKSAGFDDHKRREMLRRPELGMSGRHGVLWLTGVLATPAPRDAERHWLQLAKIVRDDTGHAGLQVLPSEEYQVRGLTGADAMVGIEKGEGELPAGSVVQYFILD